MLKSLCFFTGIVLVATIHTSTLIFGGVLHGYRNFLVSIASIFRIILGKFNYKQFAQADPYVGPVFLLGFNICVNMVLMNLYISVLNDAFAVVQEETRQIENQYEIIEFLTGKLKGEFIHCINAF